MATIWENLSVLYNYVQRPQEALDYLTRALQYYETIADEYHIAHIQLNIGNTCLTYGDFERAEQTSLRAEAMFKQLGDNLNMAHTRHNLGMIYTRTANWEEAESCFLWAIEQWQNRQDNWNLMNTMGELAGMYIAWGQRQRAQHYLDAVAQCIAHRTDQSYQGLQRELIERLEKLTTLYAD
ncbi:MAG: tetratricopeptide repeat protein [Anaerolineae bacterium]|nr:tetratricopeptide repeat protein [Anaerolineae bacterium]